MSARCCRSCSCTGCSRPAIGRSRSWAAAPTRVGDPSGKDESRRLLTDKVINENLKGIRAIFVKFLKFENADGSSLGNAIMANNADWLNTLNYIDFLRDIGRHFSINRMLAFDFGELAAQRQQRIVVSRIQLHDPCRPTISSSCTGATAARLQMGGSDQWGNIVSGIDLAAAGGRGVVRVTAPLVTTAAGLKMGKTVTARCGSTPTW